MLFLGRGARSRSGQGQVRVAKTGFWGGLLGGSWVVCKEGP